MRAIGPARRPSSPSRSPAAALFNAYPDRILFGTDTVAPSGPEPYFRVFDMWAPIFQKLAPETSRKIRVGNDERIFDEGRRRVRAWERAQGY